MSPSDALPPGLACYRTTPLFTRETVPKALLASHSVKAGVWGLLRAVRGRVRYCIDGDEPSAMVVAEGATAVIRPDVPHHVELLDPESAFLVEFYRAGA